MHQSQHEKIVSMAVIAIVEVLAVSGLAVVQVTIPLQQEPAMAQQQNNTSTTTTATRSIMPASSNKTFYVFTAEIEGLNETSARIPGDIYSLPEIVINRGDTVTIWFYNIDETGERHTFTIDAQPYSVDIDIAGDESGNATFTANQEGIFPYYCKYHLPTMTGELVVLPQPASQPVTSQPAT